MSFVDSYNCKHIEISSGLFNIKYQIFLNDLYYYGALDLLNYAMVKTHLEDISRIITPDVQLRFNKKQHRLYLDIDWAMVNENSYITKNKDKPTTL